MTEAVSGSDPGVAHRKVEAIRRFMRDRSVSVEDDDALYEMEALGGYRTNPVRVKCVMLPWEALDEALTLAEKKRQAAG
jgi:NifU-like protein involved in Fe-S cluster formation